MRGYFVLGMRRSGNHCIVQSLLENFVKVTFYNNISHCIPKRAYRVEHDKMETSIIKRLVGPQRNPEAYVFSMEDLTFAEYHKLADNMIKQFNITEPRYVVISRDLLNMLASRAFSERPVDKETWDTWHEHVSVSAQEGDKYVSVYYNKYLSCENYREDVAQKLGLRQFHVPQTVPQYGKGSSFKVGSRDPQLQENYLTRYKDPIALQRMSTLGVPLDHIKYSESMFDIVYDAGAVDMLIRVGAKE